MSWRPELGFYEKRFSLLRGFEDRSELQAFRVREEGVDARLFGGSCQLSVRQSGMALHLLTPNADEGQASAAVQRVLDELHPRPPHRFSSVAAHVLPLELDFESAVAIALRRLFRLPTASSLRFTDWSMLADLGTDEPSTSGQIEFGIVRAGEISERVSRHVGRTAEMDPYPRTPAELWDALPLPDVALFADSTFWRMADDSGSDLMAALLSFWEHSRAQAGKLVSELHRALRDDDQGETPQ